MPIKNDSGKYDSESPNYTVIGCGGFGNLIIIAFFMTVLADVDIFGIDELNIVAIVVASALGCFALIFAAKRICKRNGNTAQIRIARQNMTGHDYERYVASRLKQIGYHSIVVTKGSGDHGADIIAYAPDGVKCAIQCKYYSKPVSNKAVQEALAGSRYYGCARAIVITNSRFTKQAIEDARRIGVRLMGGFK